MPQQTVLIIDDSIDIHDLIKVGIEDQGLQVHSLFDGSECAEVALRIQPDLILLDVDMPGANGFEVCQRLKASPQTAAFPVVFLTGASTAEEKLQGLKLGAVDYITKPFDPAELSARVRSALQTKHLIDLLAQQNSALQESESRFRLLAENSSDIISRVLPDGTCAYASPACRSVLRYPPEALVGQKVAELVHPEDRALLSELNLTPGRTAVFAARVRRGGGAGNYVWLETNVRPVSDASGTNVVELHASSREITRRKQAEFLEQDRSRVLELIAQNRELPTILTELACLLERQQPGGIAATLVSMEGRLSHCAPALPEAVASAVNNEATLGALLRAVQHPPALRGRAIFFDEHPALSAIYEASEPSPLSGCWAVPVRRSDGTLCGACLLYRAETTPPDAHAQAILEMAANLATIALEHRHAAEQLSHRAHHDPLTGLPNRLLFGDRLAQALARAQRNRLHAALLYVDLDRFKFVNDTLGHEVGDQLLCKFAARVNEQTRRTDTLARLGGDEFGLILSDLESPGHAAVVADKIIQSMRLPFVIAGRELFITASVGIGIYPEDGADSSTIQKNADSAMYRAKASGSNNWQRFVPEMARAAADRLELEGSLRGATRSGQLEVHYQPIVDANRAIIGVEALARWRHPKLGLIEPSRFIPLAEETGAIMEIGQWVLRQAAQTRKRWQDDPTLPQVPMSLNISARQFAQRDFITMLTKTLQDVGVAPSDFEIELTESMLMQHVEQVADKLRELRALGIAIAIDDFGTGYSSLSYLQRLPIQRLKIDRSFTVTLSASDGSKQSNDPAAAADASIVRAISYLAHSLGMKTVAEGIETEAQFSALTRCGCDAYQGYLFARPCAADEIEPVLRGNAPVPTLRRSA